MNDFTTAILPWMPSLERRGEVPSVSVIVAAYNAAETIERAVASVVAQTRHDWELLIVDDGSTDATPRILRRLTRADGRIRAIRLARNSGSAAARNVAWRAARTPWIAVLDADDAWHPNKLAVHLAALEARPAALWSFHGVRYVRSGEALHDQRPDPDCALAQEILRSDHYVVHSSVIYARAALARLGGFDISLRRSQDWDLFVRLATDCPGAAVILPEVLADYTVRAGFLPAGAVRRAIAGQRRVVIQRLVRGGWGVRHLKLAYSAVDCYVDRVVEWSGAPGQSGRRRAWSAVAVGLAPWRRWRWRRLLRRHEKTAGQETGG